MAVPKKTGEFFNDDFGAFEKELEAHGAKRQDFQSPSEDPEKLMANEVLHEHKPRSVPPQQRPMQQPVQRIPAFVSLTRYKELMMALRDMKQVSADMHKILDSLKANRDDGTGLLDETVKNLEEMEDNVDKVKGVLRV